MPNDFPLTKPIDLKGLLGDLRKRTISKRGAETKTGKIRQV